MNSFSIRDIENFTGIKAHTLRIWEQRYQLCQPRRKDTNHRIYDGEDLKAFLKIAYLYHHGVKISRIAALSEQERNTLSLAISDQSSDLCLQINDLLSATLHYNAEEFETVISSVIRSHGIEAAIDKVIYPFLERVGILWLTDQMLPAQEHFCSAIIRTKLMVAIDSLPMNYAAADHFLLFQPEGELHEIPLLYVYFMLKKYGKKVTYFGPNVPLRDLDPFLNKSGVTALYSHMVTSSNPQLLHRYIQDLNQQYPSVRIYLSGPKSLLEHNFSDLRVTILTEMNELSQLLA
ncbi:DNA-binding transcriptional regulator, MerR family [Chitinophaga jiangningensis]|uniref:DNA-binding transcriptional regulator, MerR family n=1 Tax=Chitinophaga jiangningensis TaxID=1419482 RepID=A0A1M7CX32_9BACT|nr:MerR family transcriptional regulator [Chitinophaga jiangningensis]SHL71409.1 DNA-binding transcriptional regulator, MerR family [Chitinophaga jiangningensis]